VVSVCEKPIACSPRALTAARCAPCPPASPAAEALSLPVIGQSGCGLLSDITGQSGCAVAPRCAVVSRCASPAPDCFCARMETAIAAAAITARVQRRGLIFLIVLRPFFSLPPAPCGGGVVF